MLCGYRQRAPRIEPRYGRAPGLRRQCAGSEMREGIMLRIQERIHGTHGKHHGAAPDLGRRWPAPHRHRACPDSAGQSTAPRRPVAAFLRPAGPARSGPARTESGSASRAPLLQAEAARLRSVPPYDHPAHHTATAALRAFPAHSRWAVWHAHIIPDAKAN